MPQSTWHMYCKKITPAGADVWKSGMDMGADTILSMTIIAWAFLPVNRNAVPVCVICAPIWCHLLFFFWEELVQRL